MSLYQKYRPTSLDEIKGNQDTVTALEKYLENKTKCPHVFLFWGSKGCGKTTVARILATQLGCIGNDLKELNVADFRGIDTSREICQSAMYKPMEGTSRGWIFDEAHRWTSDAASALLKIFEDTPQHVYFFLCTTDPQKLLTTIKDRCTTFQMKPLSESQMKGLLRRVLHEEQESIPEEVYEQITQDSLGHPRAALQILDKVLQVPAERRLEVARQTAAQQSESIALCRALLENASWKKIRGILEGLKDQEPETIRRHVLGYCRATLLKTDENDQAGLIMEEFLEPFYNSPAEQLTYACYAIARHQ
jgi:DNA polymerase III subunit gamma/tau